MKKCFLMFALLVMTLLLTVLTGNEPELILDHDLVASQEAERAISE
ncbi:hypothetical protein [Pareuzebyella sediminis]|nr:hypothetical protein [Pareuzebyella sediminis]